MDRSHRALAGPCVEENGRQIEALAENLLGVHTRDDVCRSVCARDLLGFVRLAENVHHTVERAGIGSKRHDFAEWMFTMIYHVVLSRPARCTSDTNCKLVCPCSSICIPRQRGDRHGGDPQSKHRRPCDIHTANVTRLNVDLHICTLRIHGLYKHKQTSGRVTNTA